MKMPDRKKIVFFLIFAFIFLILNRSSFALDIKRKVLKNGLTVVSVERHNIPVVMATMLIKAGQPEEAAEKSGLLNLTADLLTRGTKTRDASSISEEIEFIGASLGASAGPDYITVSLSVLKKDIDKGFELFSDVILNPGFPEKEIEREKELVKGWLRQSEDEPSHLIGRAFNKEVFGDHPYSRLIQGSFETLDAVKRQDSVDLHSAYFVPNNAVLSIAGDLTEGELNSLIARFFGGWQAKDVLVRKHAVPMASGKKVLKIDKDLTQANIIIGHLGVRRDNPDYYAVSVMNYILGGGGFSSRLMTTIRDEMGLAYDVHSVFSPNKETGAFYAFVQTKNESANTVIAEVLKQMRKIRDEKVASGELEDAKSYLTGSFTARVDTLGKIANFLALVEFYGLGTDYINKYSGYIKAVTADDIQRVARKYLDPENYVLVIAADQKKANIKE